MAKFVERLRWRLRRPVASWLVGPYRSVFRGEGIEFADARPYVPGEDWRRIHWSLSARKNQPYVRLGQEERELTCVIALDRSLSMRTPPTKAQLSLEVAATFGWAAQLNGDRVRWLSFTERVEAFSPARKGERFIWGSLEALLARPPKGRKTFLRPLLRTFASLHPRRALLIIISDGFFHDDAWKELIALSHRHFLFLAFLRSPQESLTLPWGYLPIQEVETGERFLAPPSLQPTLPRLPRLRQAVLTPGSPWLLRLRQALLPGLH
ncbi:MAG: DUF58 domain-containing protein [Bacteroidia bacterium]|nr:DUF58 domain-containing protein [Bacteroidia bacterium]MDW8089325.1 DUF58 domain-containing protein [Bacteroidia bacterium]